MNSPTTSRDADPTADDRYGAITTEEDALLVYDRERPHAWLQSDATVAVER